ncbi:hypothetical protein KJ966_09900 [bacterium]|nr:hypothetical protein [bacterium]
MHLKLKKEFPDIISAQIKAHEDGGLKGDYQWTRLGELVTLFNRYQLSSILEFGCGTSSILFASLIGQSGLFETYEEDQKWLNRMLENSGDLRNRIKGNRVDRICRSKDSESVTHYDWSHNKEYDLVYVDGPTADAKEDEKDLIIRDPYGLMPNIDVELMWENGIFPKTMIIDGRRATVHRLIEKSDQKYNVYLKSDFQILSGVITSCSYCYHTIMERKPA